MKKTDVLCPTWPENICQLVQSSTEGTSFPPAIGIYFINRGHPGGASRTKIVWIIFLMGLLHPLPRQTGHKKPRKKLIRVLAGFWDDLGQWSVISWSWSQWLCVFFPNFEHISPVAISLNWGYLSGSPSWHRGPEADRASPGFQLGEMTEWGFLGRKSSSYNFYIRTHLLHYLEIINLIYLPSTFGTNSW